MRSQLIRQFLSESLIVTFIAFILAILLVTLSLPWFNELADKQMSMVWTNPYFWLISLVFIILTGLVAGSYPAFYLSSFNPVKVLKGSFQQGVSPLSLVKCWLCFSLRCLSSSSSEPSSYTGKSTC